MPNPMQDPSNWKDDDLLIDHLAHELHQKRLGLLLGAGVSAGFGLPGWESLLNDLCSAFGIEPIDSDTNFLRRAQRIKQEAAKLSPTALLDAVHAALYKSAHLDFSDLNSLKLLTSIGSLVMISSRGSASAVVTLNYDDVLETYLEYFGHVVESIYDGKHWNPRADVIVYHPHGFIPCIGKRSEDIVLSSGDYNKIIQEDINNLWRPLMLQMMRTRTFLHIGLSGRDHNIETLLELVRDRHASTGWLPYHSVWLTDDAICKDDESLFDGLGVYCRKFPNWSEYPDFLFAIAQRARKLHTR